MDNNLCRETLASKVGKMFTVAAVVLGLLLWFFILISPFLGCQGNACYINYYEDVSGAFKVAPTKSTPSGVLVDDSEVPAVDMLALDTRIDAMEGCFLAAAKNLPEPTPEQLWNWQCIRNPKYIEPIKRGCITIKVVPPVLSQCQTEYQLLPVKADDKLCEAKGLKPTPQCPCLWRTIILHDTTIITPPALYLWELPRAWSGCNNLWFSPFSHCLTL